MALNIEAGLIYLQEAFLKNKNIAHNAFNFYWLRRIKADTRVFIAIKKELGFFIKVSFLSEKTRFRRRRKVHGL